MSIPPESDGAAIRLNRRRRVAHFRNNWGTDLQQIDEEDSSEELQVAGVIGPRRRHSSGATLSPNLLGSRSSSPVAQLPSNSNAGSPRSPCVSASRLDLLRNPVTEKHSLWMPGPNTYQATVSESFCECHLERNNAVECNCGETEDTFCEWTWDNENKSSAAHVQNDGRDVLFHSEYSCGTAAVRGNKPLTCDQYYWEIKMTSPVYGTDMMIGVGSEHNNLNRNESTFSSMLGEDPESWGLSYTGIFHHAGETICYSPRFSQGSIIGVHLDMWQGTLSFYRNRHLLGVACRQGLRGKNIYPMVCSTAARSSMRIIRSKRFKTSLKFLCCEVLRARVPANLDVLNVLDMPPGLNSYLRNNLGWLLSPSISIITNVPSTKRKRLNVLTETHSDGTSVKRLRESKDS